MGFRFPMFLVSEPAKSVKPDAEQALREIRRVIWQNEEQFIGSNEMRAKIISLVNRGLGDSI